MHTIITDMITSHEGKAQTGVTESKMRGGESRIGPPGPHCQGRRHSVCSDLKRGKKRAEGKDEGKRVLGT